MCIGAVACTIMASAETRPMFRSPIGALPAMNSELVKVSVPADTNGRGAYGFGEIW